MGDVVRGTYETKISRFIALVLISMVNNSDVEAWRKGNSD